MAITQDSNADATLMARWRGRLWEGRWVLAAAALALCAIVIARHMTTYQAVGSFVLVFVATLLIPRRPINSVSRVQEQEFQDELRRNAALAFADTLQGPCILLDQRTNVAHRNGAAKEQFPTVVLGKPFSLSMRNPVIVGAIERVRRTGQPESVELHQTVPRETWYKVDVARLQFEDNMPLQTGWVVLTMFNLTEQRRIEAMRADFVANASHELRTPLASLSGFIDTLQGPAAKDAEARERFLGIMRSQATRMSKLIDDLLSLSRIELRQHVRPSGAVTISNLLYEVVDGLQTQAREAGIDVSISVPDEAVTICGDRDELYEVFENLIDNAIKYGAGGNSVEVALEPSTRAGYAWRVTVTDHGDGIAQEHVPRLTERFYRVDAESSRKKKGTGLGLAIVKHIIVRHGGLMTIRSELGQGTSVEVLLQR